MSTNAERLTIPQQKGLLWFANPTRAKAPTKPTITKLFERGLLTSAIGTTGRLTEAGRAMADKLRGQKEMAPEIAWK